MSRAFPRSMLRVTRPCVTTSCPRIMPRANDTRGQNANLAQLRRRPLVSSLAQSSPPSRSSHLRHRCSPSWTRSCPGLLVNLWCAQSCSTLRRLGLLVLRRSPSRIGHRFLTHARAPRLRAARACPVLTMGVSQVSLTLGRAQTAAQDGTATLLMQRLAPATLQVALCPCKLDALVASALFSGTQPLLMSNTTRSSSVHQLPACIKLVSSFGRQRPSA
jgi:hypothetical protein